MNNFSHIVAPLLLFVSVAPSWLGQLHAQTSTGWVQQGVGNTTPAGTSSQSGSNGFAVSGGGAGVGGIDFRHEAQNRGDLSYTIAGAYDAFHYTYQAWTGDGEIVARVGLPAGATNAQAGIMIRGGLDHEAAHIFFHVKPDGRVLLIARTGLRENFSFPTETRTYHTSTTTVSGPTWLKLMRSGGGVMSYTSNDGVTWTELRYLTIPLPSSLQIGLAVSSHQEGIAATCLFEGVAVRSMSTPLAPPAAPSDLVVTSTTSSSVSLSWTNQAAAYDSFELERSTDGANFTPLSIVGPTSHTDSGLSASTAYTYRLRGIRGGVSSGFSNSVVASTGASSAPTNLTATVISTARVDLTWSDNATNEAGFQVRRWSTASDETAIANLPANTTTFSDLSTSASTNYSYAVRVTLATGPGGMTNVASVTTPPEGATPPAAPTALNASASSSSQINLTWTDIATDETGYAIERSGDAVNFSALVTLPANSTGFSDTGLLPAQTYHYRVRATAGSVTSPASAVASATTPGISSSPTWTRTDVGAVGVAGSSSGADTAFTVTGSGADIWDGADEFSFLHQSWSGDGTFVVRAASIDYTHGWAKAGIMLRESLAPNARHVFVAIAAGQPAGLYTRTTTGGLTNLTLAATEAKPLWLMLGRAGSSFQAHTSTDGANWTPIGAPITLDLPATLYAGLAVTSHADGILARGAFDSVAFSGATGPGTVTLHAPSELHLAARTHEQLTLSWRNNAPNAGGFELERSPDAVNFTRVATLPASTSLFTDAGLTPSTTYHYRVRATLSAAVSSYSNIASATTQPPPDAPPPTAPSGLTATVASSSRVVLNWVDNSTDETDFLPELSTDGVNFSWFARTTEATATHFSPEPNTTYYYRVRAGRTIPGTGTIYSTYSNVATAITPPSAPAPNGTWETSDIGGVAAPGSASESAGIVTLTGSGDDIWNSADEFRYRYQTWTGNFVLTARVTGLTPTNPWAKAGIMFRESLEPGSPHVFMAVTAEHGTFFQGRSFAGGESTGTPGALASVLPVWIRLVRDGGNLLGYESSDGVNWTLVNSRWLYLESAFYVGLAVTSHNDGTLATASFNHLSLTGDNAPTPPPPSSSTWQHADVGSVDVAGSDDASGNEITLRGSGADIWDRADGFRFLYRVMSGDCTVEAQVSSLGGTHVWAKAGVMIRESLAADARNVFALATAGHGIAAQARTEVGGETSFTPGPWGAAVPHWLRLVRSGNTFVASASADGVTWTTLASHTLALGADVYVGFAVTSHDNTQLNTATFSDPFIE